MSGLRITEVAIRRPVFAWMIMSALIIFGAVSVSRLGVSYLPDVDFPILSIGVSWDGAAPEVMEAEVVDRIERRIIAVQGLKEIVSNVRQSSASINLEFDIDRNVDVALQEVQAAIGSLRLPDGVDPPTIRKSNPEDNPIIWIGISSETRELKDLFVLSEKTIADRIQLLPGVGEVFLGGSAERNLRVWVDNKKLKQYQLTILDVQEALRLEHSESAAGYLENETYERNLRALGEAATPKAVGDIRITRRGGAPVYFSDIRLRDVARIEDGLNDHRRITRVTGGREGLSIGIRKQIGANTVAVGDAVFAEIEAIQKTAPEDVEIQVSFDRTKFIRESIAETRFTLILSGILTALVCWLFLGNWSATVNVVLAIPTSIVGTFTVLYFMGFTLNLFTLLALSLAIGVVVDDTIMILENIMRHYDMGKDRVKAARDGAREITFAAVASSVAVIAIFLPIAFMDGVIGKFFFQFAVTMTAAVCLSLVEAVTLNPMRASRLLRPNLRTPRIVRATRAIIDFLTRLYQKILDRALRMRLVVLALAAIFFFGSLLLFQVIRQEFVPPQDQSQFGASLRTPIGSSLQFSSEAFQKFEEYLSKQPEVERYVAILGGFRGGESNRGFIFVTLKPQNEREAGQAEVMERIRGEIKGRPDLFGTLFDFSDSGLRSRGGYPIDLSIRGGDWDVLKTASDKILKQLEAGEIVRDVDTDYREGMPEVRVIPDRAAASIRGVSMDSIVRTLGTAIGGAREGRFTNDGRRYDIRLRLEPEQWRNAGDVQALQVRNAYGEMIDIDQVTRQETTPTVQQLTRVDRRRAIRVFGSVPPGVSQADAIKRATEVARTAVPEDYEVKIAGGSEGLAETFGSLYFALWLGLIAAYMVLAAQFNSFLHPIAVLMALPFSISGALGALYITGQSLNLYSMIGVILLMGIAKKNSILLVEFANEGRRREGLGVHDALIAAAGVRLRPILMTSLSSIAAALPPALALGPGAESRIPMAIAVIGGMVVSTMLTLFVVPCVYSLLARFESSA
jgi:hydrophobe/amphiphile efflux-1 (HAE1) family protein